MRITPNIDSSIFLRCSCYGVEHKKGRSMCRNKRTKGLVHGFGSREIAMVENFLQKYFNYD
jgi:hypothetical protein